MPSFIRIRLLDTLSEPVLTRILELERACFPDPWSPAMFQLSEREHILVAERKELIVGYLCLYRVLDEAHILNVAVDPACRRHGIGRKLVETVFQLTGVREIYLEVRPSNTGAITLYRQAGFVEIGRRKRYYPDGEDALIMYRKKKEVPEISGDPPSSP